MTTRWLRPGRRPAAVGLLGGLLVLSAPFLSGRASAAVANGCIQDTFQEFNGGGTLNCGANDIQIVAVTNVSILDDGCAFVGDTATFNADFTVQLNATSRHDIGLYIASDGGDAITGSCLVDKLDLATPGVQDLDGTGDDTSNPSPFGYCSPDAGATLSLPIRPCNEVGDCAGADTCEEFGPGIQDTCGDMTTAFNPVITSISNITILCMDDDGDGSADLPYSASWRQPGGNDLCLTELAAFPANTAKCKIGLRVSQIPIANTINVVKSLNPGSDTGRFDLEVDSVTELADAGNGDETGPVVVAAGLHSVGESAGTGTNLGDYGTDITCVETVGSCTGNPAIACLTDPICDDNGAGTCDPTPTTVASCTSCTSVNVTVPNQQSAIACTISNTRTVVDLCTNVVCPGPVAPCEGGQQCNPANGLCEDLPDAALGTPCEADADLCTNCAAANPPCEGGQLCNPLTGLCEDQADAPIGAPCDLDSNLCTSDACDGNGACVFDSNVVCAAPAPPCEAGQACVPATGLCADYPDAFPGVPCDADANLCTNDECDGNGLCVFDSNVVCAGGTPCAAGEQCNPANGLCENLPDAPLGTPCDADANLCTIDQCDGNGSCVFDSNLICLIASPPCEAGQACDPGSGCVNLPDAAAGTSCDLDSNLCTIDQCNGSGSCLNQGNVPCEPPQPPCEGGELCNPGTGVCETQPDAGVSTPCEADGNLCTSDHCDGSGQCVFLSGLATCCGDGIVDPNAGENCDPPGDPVCPGGDICPASCICSCGDGLLEPGEGCEPPQLLPVENCGNGRDDDGDGRIDCRDREDCPAFCKADAEDPDDAVTAIACDNHRACRVQFGRRAECFSVGTCDPTCQVANRCVRIDRDPAVIRFGRNEGDPDRFKFHGRFPVAQATDLSLEGFSVTIANADGVIYTGSLLPGDLVGTLRRSGFTVYSFRDPTAKEGGIRDGLGAVKLLFRTVRGRLNLLVRVKAFGDFSAASDPRMSIQIDAGSVGGYNEGDWTPITRGWRAHF
jgi:hypothetical protein